MPSGAHCLAHAVSDLFCHVSCVCSRMLISGLVPWVPLRAPSEDAYIYEKLQVRALRRVVTCAEVLWSLAAKTERKKCYYVLPKLSWRLWMWR